MTELTLEKDNMQKIVERLKKEKEISIVHNKKQGIEEGFEDAQTLPYDCIQNVVMNYERLISNPDYTASQFLKYIVVGEYEALYDWIGEKRLPILEGFITNEELYFQGWIEGVKHFWSQIEDQL